MGHLFVHVVCSQVIEWGFESWWTPRKVSGPISPHRGHRYSGPDLPSRLHPKRERLVDGLSALPFRCTSIGVSGVDRPMPIVATGRSHQNARILK